MMAQGLFDLPQYLGDVEDMNKIMRDTILYGNAFAKDGERINPTTIHISLPSPTWRLLNQGVPYMPKTKRIAKTKPVRQTKVSKLQTELTCVRQNLSCLRQDLASRDRDCHDLKAKLEDRESQLRWLKALVQQTIELSTAVAKAR